MTTPERDDIICYRRKKGQMVRKGKAMKHRPNDIFMTEFANTFRANDNHGIIMPAAEKAEWSIKYCLHRAGSSGYLGPGVTICAKRRILA